MLRDDFVFPCVHHTIFLPYRSEKRGSISPVSIHKPPATRQEQDALCNDSDNNDEDDDDCYDHHNVKSVLAVEFNQRPAYLATWLYWAAPSFWRGTEGERKKERKMHIPTFLTTDYDTKCLLCTIS